MKVTSSQQPPPKQPKRRHYGGKPGYLERRKNVQDQTHPRLKVVNDIHKGKTAWIFGSGVSLNNVWDWQIPKGIITIALNAGMVYFWNSDREITYSGIAPKKLYRRKLDYWFCFDQRVFDKRLRPEWEYANLALRHPTATKLLPRYVPSFPGLPNIYKFNLEHKKNNFHCKFRGSLITGDSIITPALHYCYLAGIKRIFLSGVDCCYMRSKGKYQRYNDCLKSMRWQGSHINRTGSIIIAPNGEQVRIDTMYKNHLCQIMAQLRFLQSKGIDIIKTSVRGMLEINAIENENTMKAIIDGNESIKFQKT